MKRLSLILCWVILLLPAFSAADTTPASSDGSTPSTGGSATTPASSDPYSFQRQGIFDCNQNGSYAMSVGATSAMGGSYVPVADAAVELNTGTLVYKECVLREVVDREREQATSGLLKQAYTSVQSGRNGNAYYVRQPTAEIVTNASDPAFLATIKAAQQHNLDSSVVRTIAQNYEQETRSPYSILDCPLQGDASTRYSGQPGSFDFSSFWASADPACYPLGQAELLQNIATQNISQANSDLAMQWQWGRGFYPRVDENGNVVTPSSVVQESFQQILGSPVRQLENANDIGQMIGALYAGATTQILGDVGGLAGLSQSNGGQPSYLNQLAAESATGLRGAATNAALQILSAAQQVESAYYQAMSAIGAALTQTSGQLRAAEAQCWSQVIARACSGSLAADNTCTATISSCSSSGNITQINGISTQEQGCSSQTVKLKVATSTAFSDAVISAKITPLAGPATDGINTSKTALQLISNLIQGVTNTNSVDAQRVALQQLDNLVAQHKLHTQTDLSNAKQQQGTVTDTMTNLLQTVAQIWGGSGTDGASNIAWDGTTNPGNGWCNVNNSDTIAAWQQKWKTQ